MATNYSQKSHRRELLLVGLLTAIMAVKGALWSLAFPLHQGPDEDDHYAVIQFVAETGRLPDEADVWLPDDVALARQLADVGRLPYFPDQRQGFSQTEWGFGEKALAQLPASTRTSTDQQIVGKLMHATPLYYILGAGVYRLFDGSDVLARSQIQRLFAILVSSPTIIVAYLIARQLFPGDEMMRLTVPALVTFHPMLTEISAVVSVDGLLILCYSLLIWLCLRLLAHGLTRRIAVAIGIIFSIGALTKPTLLGFVPLVAGCVYYDYYRHPTRRRPIVNHAVWMNLIILPPLLWWMFRSRRLNDDLFYFNPVTEGHRIIENPFYNYPFFAHMIDYWQSVWGGIFVSWWAHFGWLDTSMPPWIYDLLRGMTWLAIGGLVLTLFRRWRAKKLSQESIAPWLFLALTMLVPILLLQYYDLAFWREYGVGRGLQGRYWLGTIVPMLVCWAAGLLAWLPASWRPTAHFGLRLGMILFNLAALLGYILPRYYL